LWQFLPAAGRGLPVGQYHVAVIPTPLPDTSSIPARFESPATSGLSVDVQPPETRFDIDVPRSP